jgi:7-cyano-7-deazaguanine reductase
MKTNINEIKKQSVKDIAGKHLGRTSDGGFMAPYLTPDKHDTSLLVAIPRVLGREENKIDVRKFVGYEVWHAYEMSFLSSSGQPVTGILKVTYPHTSYAMVESKSHKLFLNSFDLERFASVEEVERVIKEALSTSLQTDVQVKLHLAEDNCGLVKLNPIFKIPFTNIDKKNFKIDTFKEDTSLLDEASGNEDTLTFHTTNLRSLCEITRQKDTGNSYIYMKGKTLPSLEGLAKYVFSMRDAQHFHENITELLFDTLMNRYNCQELLVANIYNRRGGLDIHSIRASSQEVLDKVVNNYNNVDYLFERTAQQ